MSMEIRTYNVNVISTDSVKQFPPAVLDSTSSHEDHGGHLNSFYQEVWCIGSWWGNRREGDNWEDLGVDGWIILGWISRKWDVGIWTGLGWPGIETGGGRL